MKSFSAFLLEKKDHIIKRLKNLSDAEKDQVISFFAKKPNLENQVDWQNRDLTFKDFQKVMDTTKTERKKAVKKLGIGGLKKGKDYIELKYDNESWQAFIPLHWEASKLLASTKIGGVEGKWCTAYQKTPSYFMKYAKGEHNYLVYFIKEGDKNALRLSSTFEIEEFRDKDNGMIKEFSDSAINVKGPEFDDFISANKASFNVARKKLDALKLVSWLDDKIAAGVVIVQNASFKVSETFNLLIWKDGIWVQGAWDGGVWEDGTWKDGVWIEGNWEGGVWKAGTWYDGTWKGGVWEKGIWSRGFWKDGLWETGVWHDGIWYDGTWKGGVWEKGLWSFGTWEDGTWKGGTWKLGMWETGLWETGIWDEGTWKGGTWEDGIWYGGIWEGGTWEGGRWKGGYDKDRKYHGVGDSPDKWSK